MSKQYARIMRSARAGEAQVEMHAAVAVDGEGVEHFYVLPAKYDGPESYTNDNETSTFLSSLVPGEKKRVYHTHLTNSYPSSMDSRNAWSLWGSESHSYMISIKSNNVYLINPYNCPSKGMHETYYGDKIGTLEQLKNGKIF